MENILKKNKGRNIWAFFVPVALGLSVPGSMLTGAVYITWLLILNTITNPRLAQIVEKYHRLSRTKFFASLLIFCFFSFFLQQIILKTVNIKLHYTTLEHLETNLSFNFIIFILFSIFNSFLKKFEKEKYCTWE